jgi:hypothetical protein
MRFSMFDTYVYALVSSTDIKGNPFQVKVKFRKVDFEYLYKTCDNLSFLKVVKK